MKMLFLERRDHRRNLKGHNLYPRTTWLTYFSFYNVLVKRWKRVSKIYRYLLSRSDQAATIDDFWLKSTEIMIFTKSLFVYLLQAYNQLNHSRACFVYTTCLFFTSTIRFVNTLGKVTTPLCGIILSRFE